MTTADAIQSTLQSANVPDANSDPANVVDVLASLASATNRVGVAIVGSAAAGPDAAGVHVDSLTESVMGVTAGLMEIARAINSLAEAVREKS